MGRTGKLFILSGPAGIGKTTAANALLANAAASNLQRSVTATTRHPRQGESNENHYHFISKDKFLEWIGSGIFLEYAVVHGNYYGSLKSDVLEKISRGMDVILIIDVQGFLQIMEKHLNIEIVSIFFKPKSLEILEERMRGRSTESDAEIARRINASKDEISFANRYKYVIVSESREHDFNEILRIYMKEKNENNGR
ncbi:MAG: guanylate kinase [Puniceicoccales bacterium]|jgi:guanylate kinase|nr:guanylate kinase [Puniceicoccales bacterium]